MATWCASACQCMVPTRRGAREMEARRAARGVSKEGGSKGAARDLVAGCLVPASWRRSGLNSGRLAQRGDATPRWQCSLLAVRRRGGWQSDAMAAHRGLDGAPWCGRVQNFTGGQRGEEQTQAGNGDGTPPRTAVDATAKGGRWTRGHSCGVEW
jgi:hypothetical protein